MAKCFTQLTLFVLRNKLSVDLKMVKYLILFAGPFTEKDQLNYCFCTIFNFQNLKSHALRLHQTVVKFSNTFSV